MQRSIVTGWAPCPAGTLRCKEPNIYLLSVKALLNTKIQAPFPTLENTKVPPSDNFHKNNIWNKWQRKTYL
jgi:hypothetical protein